MKINFIKGMFADYGLGKRMLLLFGIFLLTEIFGNVIALGFGKLGEMFLSTNNVIRLEQFVGSMVSFAGAAILFYYLVSQKDNFFSFFKFEKKHRLLLYLLAVLALASLLPLVNYTAYINENMKLPESLSLIEEKMKEMEELAKALTLDLLKTDSFFLFLTNIIVIAIAPAFCEEMLFRGALQKTLQERMAPWLAIVITSILFSAMHLQFYGFIPRFLLSVFLGLLFYISGSMKLNMFAHCFNNAVAVIVYYFCSMANVAIDDAPTETLGKEDAVAAIVSTLIFAGIMWVIYRHVKKE